MSKETKDRILDVAERLFADNGVGGTSLRDITSEAGVNLAAVNYHFGSKEELLAAALERRMRAINERRIVLLDALEGSSVRGAPSLEAVLRVLIAPIFEKEREWGEAAVKFRKLLGRVHYETNEDFNAGVLKHFEDVIARFEAALHRAIPELDRREVDLRLAFLVGGIAYSMWGEWLTVYLQRPSRSAEAMGVTLSRDPDELLEELIQFGAGGMTARSVKATKRTR
jgi:AcrR family transcriptional regulator